MIKGQVAGRIRSSDLRALRWIGGKGTEIGWINPGGAGNPNYYTTWQYRAGIYVRVVESHGQSVKREVWLDELDAADKIAVWVCACRRGGRRR
ncbi:uncharacterized protein N7469_006961 [Penicillium citrinum]|uniref:Uncharacterized protein n=1 Tax=Penicillium citrinum TaxID=5077 RepID=A0A9W9TMW4_PENCI|nr:uncharacterized protein N7469_006961 [Penicillium citrinum]KAJ5226955.1 hypothetical protein N7469_006961 [Penicillium citrinum]